MSAMWITYLVWIVGVSEINMIKNKDKIEGFIFGNMMNFSSAKNCLSPFSENV